MGKGEIKYETYLRSTNLIKTRFQKILAKVTAIIQESQGGIPTQVQSRVLHSYLVELRKKRADFEGNFQRIIEHCSEEDVPEATLSDHSDQINDLYISIVASIESVLPPEVPSSPASAADTSFQNLPQATQHVRLPMLDLKTFDGNVQNWVAYINLFDATVHQNPALSSVIKFQYLLSSLKDEPLSLIKSMNISAANYPIAYQILKDRYHNSRRLSTLHLNAILDLPNIDAGRTQGLRTFLNLFTEHTQSLSALNCDISSTANPLLSAHLLRKLDQELRKKLENFRSAQDCDQHSLPSVQHIIQFLNDECNQTEDASLHFPQSSKHHKANFSRSHASPRSHALVTTAPGGSGSADGDALGAHTPRSHAPNTSRAQNKPPCFACNKEGHKIYSCALFLGKTPNERVTIVKSHKRCFSCLGAHMIDTCTSKGLCNTCKKRHHSLLHFEKISPIAPAVQPTPTGGSVVASAQNSSISPAVTSSTVLLGTALVKLTSPNGNTHVFRALLDSGSQLSFVSERAVQLLNARRINSTHNIMGISTTHSQTKGLTNLDLSSLGDKNIASQHAFHILNRISADLPRTPIKPEVWQLTRQYVLADPTFHLPGKVDVLIGCALYPLLLTQQQYSLGPDLPHMIGTHLGFIVMGSAPCAQSPAPSSNLEDFSSQVISLHATTDYELHTSLQRFWTQEELPVNDKKTMEQELCDESFRITHSRETDGRYVVRLPFKKAHPPLGASQPMAERRYHALERKFAIQPQFSQRYHEFMSEYSSLDHMVKCQDIDLSSPHYYLPHHGVLKDSSSTTKLRTVFDASAKTSSGVSLNDILLTGRKLQTNICDVLSHFRKHNIVFSCDIRQMYRQIRIHEDDRQFQLILWRDKPTDPLSTYKLNTVTYGINNSPYLAIKTLHQLADDEGDAFPAAAQVLRTQTYVDDIITGADTEESALELQGQLVNLLRRGGFELRKWISNSPRLLQALPEGHLESPVFLQESEQPHFSILGLHWSPTSDCFTYSLNFPVDSKPTKRSVLSLIAKVYDPCGFLAPCIMGAKCFMQFLWTTGLSWDDPLPIDLVQKWNAFVTDAQNLTKVSIPRSFQLSHSCTVELHGFSDASESGYAAVVYFRCQLSNGEVIIRPIMAKTRVAPLKRVTLPRLELCGAHLLAQLVAHCQTLFTNIVAPDHIYAWCDSSIVLTWLRTPPYKLKTYVANRVSQTQELIPIHSWRHIASADNPADCASRGIPASQLVDHALWWTGPPWLKCPHFNWPAPLFVPVDVSTLEETKTTPLVVLTATPAAEWDLLSTYSSWDKLQRIVALILRFIHNCRGSERRKGLLSMSEITRARLRIFRLVQHSAFLEDIEALCKQRKCSTRLQRLKPFLDTDGLLRVGGRLNRTSLPEDVRHPVLLPKKHHIVELLVDHCHKINLHAGPQLTQAILSQSVWILSGRSAIRSRIFKCITCFKIKPRNLTPLMGDLPPARVTVSRPFLSTGTDYCGPFMVKTVNLRSMKQVKVYLCIFVCMVTKAVHIEVVTDLTADGFIAALTRFISRRGFCSDIYSDCGTNYVGADAILKRLIDSCFSSPTSQEAIHRFSAQRGISFHFNPPAAPHQGGLWEAAVKSAKYHLKRVMGDAVLTLSQFMTLSTQVEAMLNSRPLTPLSSDPSDMAALTPGHFLVGAPLMAVPEPEVRDLPSNRLRHWQIVQAFHQRIWQRWSLEYLHMLQQRSKWTTVSENLKIGDLVLIHTPSSPLTWPLARITGLHPGKDNIVRVVDLKTATGHLTRPAVKVFPLPMS